MSIKNRLFGFSTKNLYVAELMRKEKVDKMHTTLTSFIPKKFVLVKNIEYNSYKDVFTKTNYGMKHDYYSPMVGTILVQNLSPIISTKRRIKYKDAEGILKTKNTVYIKK